MKMESLVWMNDSYIMKTDPLDLLQKSTPILNTTGGTQHFLSAKGIVERIPKRI